jgi:hypothetical protein
MRLLLCLLCAGSGLAAGSQSATVTGRVFDVYHRPVRAARVAPMERRATDGPPRLVAGTQATVDDAGMYRLTLPPGRYVLAVLPPPRALDFAAVFPAYMQDTSDFAHAQSIEVRPGELRPFTDFLVLEVESHRLAGQVTGIPRDWKSAAVVLSSASGYTGPLQVVSTDADGRFHFDHVPAGSYRLTAGGPATRDVRLDILSGFRTSASLQIDVAKPDTTGIRIHLKPAAR